MRQSASARPRLLRRRRRTVPAMATVVVVVAVALLSSLCLPTAADARTLHYHRKHRRHYRQHHRNGHIALPPAAAQPPDVVGGDPPAAETPDVEDAPPPTRVRGCKKPCPPSSKAPAPAPAKPPAFSLPNPPSPAPAKAPWHSHGTPPRTHPRAKPPSSAPASTPSSSPELPPSLPPCTSAKPPRLLAPAKPPMPLPPARSQPVVHPPATPPVAHPPAAKAPKTTAPAPPPQLSPAKPQPPVNAPQLPPAKAPTPSPLPVNQPAVPPVSTPHAPAPAAKNVLDVRAFGASGNGSSSDDDTRAFRLAWKAACSSDSATLLVPSDGVFTITSTIFAGPCKPGLTFQIDGVLMPPDGPASWPASDSRKQWLVFYRADGMTLAGRGTIEGNGEEWWGLPCKPHKGPNGSTLPGPCDSPALIRFFLSNDVTVLDLRVENSPKFHLKFDDCQRVRVDGLFVSSPAFSPNTDGIHLENTTSVQILNSRIYNGDDCVSIGAGCSDVHIENVTCGHGHGISIGSLGVRNTRACVSNVTVRNARVIDSDNGVRIKTWQGGAGVVSGVEFAAVRMQNVKNCIVIDQYYCLGAGCANQSSAVRVAGVAYRDIKGTYNPRAGAPIRLACSDAVACTGITMAGVELIPATGEEQLADPFCWNAYGLMETMTLPPVHCLQEGRPESLQDQLMSC